MAPSHLRRSFPRNKLMLMSMFFFCCCCLFLDWIYGEFSFPLELKSCFLVFSKLFYFGIILNLKRSCKDSTRTFSYTSHLFPPFITIFHDHGILFKTNIPTPRLYYQLHSRLYLDVASFSMNVFFLFLDSPFLFY
uniref:Uncharacterized protein n=1 Tax=Macaca fascicularis TaxID=9541 RepID=Q9GLZ2_MACFA|nr:hypothetical protein [Macaca fascicularis]